MDQASPEGVVAPVESQTETPTTTADAAPVEAVKPADPPAKPEGDEPKGVAKRIKELTEARRAAEAREARLLALLEQRQTPTQQPATEEEAEKSYADFQYNDKAYRDYLEKRANARAEKAAKDVAERYRREAEAMSRRAKFDERVEAFAKTVEDYHDVVTDSTPVSEGMADAIMDSDEAGALMYYLGSNPEEARKLYNLSPAKAGREIERLEQRLVAERKKAAEKPVSKAPPPAPKIEGADPGAGNLDPSKAESDTLSDAEWVKKRRKQLERKRSS